MGVGINDKAFQFHLSESRSSVAHFLFAFTLKCVKYFDDLFGFRIIGHGWSTIAYLIFVADAMDIVRGEIFVM